MNAIWKSYRLKLNKPFVLSYGSFDERTSFIVKLTEDQLTGLGEATAISYYGWVEEEIQKELDLLVDEINAGVQVNELLARKEISPPVRNALQCAYIDLVAEKNGQSIGEYYNIRSPKTALNSSITISGDEYGHLKQQLEEHDWPIYKIKMTGSADGQKLKLIADHPEKLFRIDANSGWNIEWIKAHAAELNSLNIEFIEQPFTRDDEKDIAQLKKWVKQPVFADESCQDLADVNRCAKDYDGINIKLMKCGGWDKALEMIQQARTLNLQVMLGCMTETSVGISHAMQLADMVDFVDVDGSYLIANDPAIGSYLVKGVMHKIGHAGSGARLGD